jgi:hypothetical protein
VGNVIDPPSVFLVMRTSTVNLRRLVVPAAGALLLLTTSCASTGTASDGRTGGAEVSASAGPVPDATETRAPGPTSATTPTVSTLRRGDSGPAVLALQKRLDTLGYWLGSPDGTFGSLTEQAVFAVQGAAGLDRDGVVGPATAAAIDDGTLPQPRSDRGAVTEIDRGTGTISFVRDGQVQLVLHTSTGTFEPYLYDGRRLLADTPEGRFSVSWAYDGLRNGALGELYRPRYFHPDGIAVHGYPHVPAYPASHGCARVTDAAMDMVWARDLMPRSSEVLVY